MKRSPELHGIAYFPFLHVSRLYAGKGHNTTLGLKAYLQHADAPGQIVWTALRKEQIHDQTGLELIPLHGRNDGNCHKLGEAQALSRRGYSVRQTLCERRCPVRDSCAYLRQFTQAADFFAPQPLLQATNWWQDAAVVVLDEFDPARLTRIVPLDSADLARMAQHADDPHAQTLLRWLAALLGSATDRAIAGGMLLAELETQARRDGLDLATTLQAALANLPDEEEVAMLPGFPQGATLADYEGSPYYSGYNVREGSANRIGKPSRKSHPVSYMLGQRSSVFGFLTRFLKPSRTSIPSPKLTANGHGFCGTVGVFKHTTEEPQKPWKPFYHCSSVCPVHSGCARFGTWVRLCWRCWR